MAAILNFAEVKPYADMLNDGLMQMSFTLPLPYSLAANKAAELLATKMGLLNPEVIHSKELTKGYTYFIVYAKCPHAINFQLLKDQIFDIEYMEKEQIEEFIQQKIGRPLVVVGASTGTDTHSVGIDAMLNLKGFNGENGLEAYQGFITYNLGSQVPNGVLIARALEVKADAIMVSQTVTQQKLHIHNLTQLVDMLEAEGQRKKMLLICGGPRLTNELAKELGYDAGFSKGCYPNHVATYIAREVSHRMEASELIRDKLLLEDIPGA
jgi:beta-lysine 5,6-aminomutase beta subunit